MKRKTVLPWLGWAYCWLVVLFVMLPVLIIFPASFGASESLEFPPSAYSVRWYVQVLSDPQWVSSAILSARTALLASLLATVAGLLVALSQLLVKRVQPTHRAFLMLPMVAPHIVLATGLFSVLLSSRLLGDTTVLAVVHATLAIPLTMVIIVNAVDSVDPLLWTAASTLGARWWTIILQIILPLLLTGIVVAFVLAFIVSWDEVTFAIFIGPSIIPTLPARMFYYLRELITPALAAVASLLVVMTGLVGVLILAVRAIGRTHQSTENSGRRS